MEAEQCCVLKRLPPCAKSFFDLDRSMGFTLLRRILFDNAGAVCTVHECQYFKNKFALSISVRRKQICDVASLFVPDFISMHNLHQQKNVPREMDFPVTVFVSCTYLALHDDHPVMTLQLSEFWNSVHNGVVETALSTHLLLQNLGKKNYAKSLYSALNMYHHCEQGLYKVSFACRKCRKKHCVLITHT